MSAVIPMRPQGEVGRVIESVVVRGDLSVLNQEERSAYYFKVCETVGLNPATKPFEFIQLNGKLVLYALKSCTEQLRTIHKVSVTELTETEREGVFIVTAKVQNGEGRTDAAKGAVAIKGLQGEALANALMKAETKAKRRATLSICGLGLLDEIEIEDVPQATKAAPKTTLPKKDAKPIYTKLQVELDAETSCDSLAEWGEANAERIRILPEDWQDILRLRYQEKMLELRQRAEKGHDADGVVWEEDSERPATAADTAQVIAMPNESATTETADGIPDFLRRAPPPTEVKSDVVDEKAWLANLTRVFGKQNDVDGVKYHHLTLVKPQKDRVSADTYRQAESIARTAMQRIAADMLAA
jgi:hypothetical protein